jgi:hypothetical protein
MACNKQTIRQAHSSTTSSVTAITPGRVTINNLPNEVIVSIIRHVPAYAKSDFPVVPHCQHSLLQLALCSRSLHALVEPILYEYFHHNDKSPVCAVQLFLRMILVRPDLAQQVKGIRTMASDSEYDDGRLDVSCFKVEDWARIRNKIEEVDGSTQERDEWVKDLEKGHWEAMAALILTLTPNLRILKFKEWPYDDSPYPNLMRTLSRARQLQVERQAENQFALWNLNKVMQNHYDTEGGLSIDQLAPLLAIPSVKTFWGKMICDEGAADMDEWPLSNIDLTHIEELSLFYISMDHDTIIRFLRCFPRLKKLYYRHGDAGYEDFEPPRLMAALSHLKPHLQDLTIINDNKVARSGIDHYPIGSLSSFKPLRRLQADWEILTGGDNRDAMTDGFSSRQDIIDALPAGLEELRVSDGKYIKIAPCYIFNLLEHKHRFPALKMLNLEWECYRHPDKPGPDDPHIHPGFTKEQSLEVLSRCNEAGVEMMMTTLPPLPRYISYPAKDEEGNTKKDQRGWDSTITIGLEYPYKDYEKICKEHGCDPETGRPYHAFFRS